MPVDTALYHAMKTYLHATLGLFGTCRSWAVRGARGQPSLDAAGKQASVDSYKEAADAAVELAGADPVLRDEQKAAVLEVSERVQGRGGASAAPSGGRSEGAVKRVLAGTAACARCGGGSGGGALGARLCSLASASTLNPSPWLQILKAYSALLDAAAAAGYDAGACLEGMRAQKDAVMRLVNDTGDYHWDALQVGGWCLRRGVGRLK